MKTTVRPTKPSHDIDIMSCQDSKASDAGLPRSKELLSDPGRKKRIAGDSKMSHSRQKLTEMPSAKACSHSSKKLISGDSKGEDPMNHTDGDLDGESQENATEDRICQATEDRGRSSVRTRKINAAFEQADYEDEYSTSEETSISSGCSSTGSVGKGTYIFFKCRIKLIGMHFVLY